MRRIVFLALLALAAQLPAAGTSAQSAADKAMAQRIGSVLKESGQLRDYRVGVKFQDGVAWLNGTVTDAQQANTAAALAREIPGVSHVVCQLQYPGDSGAVRSAIQRCRFRTPATRERPGVTQATRTPVRSGSRRPI